MFMPFKFEYKWGENWKAGSLLYQNFLLDCVNICYCNVKILCLLKHVYPLWNENFPQELNKKILNKITN